MNSQIPKLSFSIKETNVCHRIHTHTWNKIVIKDNVLLGLDLFTGSIQKILRIYTGLCV